MEQYTYSYAQNLYGKPPGTKSYLLAMLAGLVTPINCRACMERHGGLLLRHKLAMNPTTYHNTLKKFSQACFGEHYALRVATYLQMGRCSGVVAAVQDHRVAALYTNPSA